MIAPAVSAPEPTASVLPSTPSIAASAIAALPGGGSIGAANIGGSSRSEPAARATAAVEVDAVLGTLRDYEAAYESLDVVAAAEVFPSVDRRALSRAFSLLKSQEVAFDPCKVDITGSSAVARCPGVARYVRRIGIQHPLEQRYEWVFDMRKKGDDWQIASVTTLRDDDEKRR